MEDGRFVSPRWWFLHCSKSVIVLCGLGPFWRSLLRCWVKGVFVLFSCVSNTRFYGFEFDLYFSSLVAL